MKRRKNIEPNTPKSEAQQKPMKKKRSILQCETLETLEDKRKRIANEFNEWSANLRETYIDSDNKRARRMRDFRRKFKVSEEAWQDWYTDNADGFADRIREGKEDLGTHLWAGWAEGILQAGAVAPYLHNFSDEFKKNDDYQDQREIKKIEARAAATEASQKPQNITINLADGQKQSDS